MAKHTEGGDIGPPRRGALGQNSHVLPSSLSNATKQAARDTGVFLEKQGREGPRKRMGNSADERGLGLAWESVGGRKTELSKIRLQSPGGGLHGEKGRGCLRE